MNKSKNLSLGFIPTPIVLGVFVISAALIAGFILRQPNSSQAQSSNKFILPPSVFNRDIQATVSDPTSSGTWDGIVKGSLCFDVNPPSFGGKYRGVLVMDLKDEPNAVIGASVSRLLTNPSTVKCGSRTLRKDVFNIAFNLPDKDRWAEACPEIKILIETEGTWKQRPQEEIARLSREFVCPGGVPSAAATPTAPAATATPPAPTLAPTSQPLPQTGISGTISIYSCEKPKTVTLDVFDTENKTGLQTLKLQSREADNSIWLKPDQGDDRTHVYGYKVSKDSQGVPFAPNSKIAVSEAFAAMQTILGRDTSFTSLKDSNNILTLPATHDKTIDAQYLTCGCPFHARSYVKDAATGDILRTTQASLGTANDMQIIKLGDTLQQTFNNGVIDVRADFFDFAERFIPEPFIPFSDYGIDGISMVRLYAPGYNVVKQECESKGQVAACPGYTLKSSKDTSSKDFQGLRVTCGVDVEYGWVIEKTSGAALTTQSLFDIEDADIDGNGVVNILDLNFCEASMGEFDAGCDLDSNGFTNSTDFTGVIQYLGESVE